MNDMSRWTEQIVEQPARPAIELITPTQAYCRRLLAADYASHATARQAAISLAYHTADAWLIIQRMDGTFYIKREEANHEGA